MTEHFLAQANGKNAYDDTGSGPLEICIPSMGDLRGEYRFLTPRLVEAGYRVITMDVRGHGGSSTGWDDYSVAGVGSDVVALIRSLGSGPAILIGDSMAGGAIVWAAAEAPELISGLVLIDPFVRGEGSFWMNLILAALFARPWGPAAWVRYYTTLYPTHKPADFAQYTAALKKNLAQKGRLEALHGMLRAPKKASEERLARVKTPALVIMGSQDPDFKDPEAEARWVADSLHTTYQMIPQAGHYPQAEMPELTAPVILAFLQTLKEAAHAA